MFQFLSRNLKKYWIWGRIIGLFSLAKQAYFINVSLTDDDAPLDPPTLAK